MLAQMNYSNAPNSTISPNSSPTFFGWDNRMQILQRASGSAQTLSTITPLQAKVSMWERDMKARKQQFGLVAFELLDTNAKMRNESCSKNNDVEVERVFSRCVSDIQELKEQRVKKTSELIRASRPKALCYNRQVTGESVNSFDSQQSSSNESNQGGWFSQARNAVQRTASKAKLNSDLSSLERDILLRKKQFGVEFYDAITRCQNFEARDPFIQEMYRKAREDIDQPAEKTLQALQEIEDIRNAASGVMSHEEIKSYVWNKPALWAMLGANTGISEEPCKVVALRVLLSLASGKQGQSLEAVQISKYQFEKFEKQYVHDPKGSQEFFHRCVFAAFDEDGNGVLDCHEIDKFLDLFYVSGSIFRGDARLPEKEALKKLIYEKLDENGDGEFSFDEIRSLICGSAAAFVHQ